MQNTNQTDRGKPDLLEHPTREEWMAYLYGELPQGSKAALDAHLQSCPSCQPNVAEWRSTLAALEAWRLPRRRRLFRFAEPALKWGIAALFALGFGYGMGRFSVPAGDAKALPAGIESSLRLSLMKELRDQIRDELKREVQTGVAAAQQQTANDLNAVIDQTSTAADLQARQLLTAYHEKLQEENQSILAQLRNLDGRQTRLAGEVAALRRDAETVAVLTEDSFRQMYRFASHSAMEDPISEATARTQKP